MKGKDFTECFGCEHYKECEHSNCPCYYNAKVTKNDLMWRDNFTTDANLLDGFTYDDIILALRCENPENRNYEGAKKIVKDILEQRLEDMNYLLKLNFDQIMEEVNR